MKYFVLEYKDRKVSRAFLIKVEGASRIHKIMMERLFMADAQRSQRTCPAHKHLLVRYAIGPCDFEDNTSTVKAMYAMYGLTNGDKVTSVSFDTFFEFYEHIGFDSEQLTFAEDSYANRAVTVH